jgi:hypothetical protein
MAKFLDGHPRAFLDMAARFGQLQYQSKEERDRVRDFIIKYQDRLLYATDATTLAGDDDAAVSKEVRAKWRADWLYLTSDETMMVPELDGEFPGLKLPRAVIDKLYFTNARAAFAIVPADESSVGGADQ